MRSCLKQGEHISAVYNVKYIIVCPLNPLISLGRLEVHIVF